MRLISDEREVALLGTVARCRLTGMVGADGPVYEAGIRFEDVMIDQAEQLQRMIVERGISHVERDAFGRFTLRDDDGVILEDTPEFVVRKLSRSGMLIQSEYIPVPEQRLSAEIRMHDQTLEAELRVVYVHRIEPAEPSGADGGAPRADIGVEILEISDEDRAAYYRMIDQELALALT